MVTLWKIMRSERCISNAKLLTPLKNIADLIVNLKEAFNELSIKEIMDLLDLISKEVSSLKKILGKIYIPINDEFIITRRGKKYFENIQENVENRFKKIDLSFQFNLIEAIEELYKTLEIMQDFKIAKNNSNEIFILNIIHELFLNLEQHYLYHYKKIKRKGCPIKSIKVK